MKSFTFTTETTQKVLDYLAARPYGEVTVLVNELMAAVKIQQAAALKAAQTNVHQDINNSSGTEKTA